MNKKISFTIGVCLIIIVFGITLKTLFTPKNNTESTNKSVILMQDSTTTNKPVVDQAPVNIITENLSLNLGNVFRKYTLQRPSDKASINHILIALHSENKTSEQFQNTMRLGELALKNNTLIAYPDGLNNGWNDIRAKSEDVDDIGFLTELVITLQKEYNITKNETSLLGYSNGGFMAQTLVCQNDNLVHSAIFIGANLLNDLAEQCKSFPTNVIYVLSSKDTIVPYSGGEIDLPNKGSVVSAQDTLINTSQINKCGDKSEEKETTTILTQKVFGCQNDGQIILATYVKETHLTLPLKVDIISLIKENGIIK